MKFGKFTVQQIIQNCACGLFCFEIKTKSEYGQLRQAAIKVDSELVEKWDVCVGKCGFPVYLNKMGQSMSKLYAIQYNYYIVAFEDIEFELPEDLNTFVCTELNKMQDHRKEQVLELVKKLAEEERSDLYWFIESTGNISTARVSSSPTDAKDRKNVGNYFKTKEEAELEVKRRLAITKWKKLHQMIESRCTMGNLAYFPTYDCINNMMVVTYASSDLVSGGLIFSSFENCKKAIEDFGEMRLRDLYFGYGAIR